MFGNQLDTLKILKSKHLSPFIQLHLMVMHYQEVMTKNITYLSFICIIIPNTLQYA